MAIGFIAEGIADAAVSGLFSVLHEVRTGADISPAVVRLDFLRNLRLCMIWLFIFNPAKDSNMLVEVCANSLESALVAQEAGADRIELCTELGVGGITPSYGLIQMVRERLDIPVHVLIRPRSGHFTYSDLEFEVMLKDIAFCVENGVDGIVSGVLLADCNLDVERTKALIEASRPLKFTFHRAFDWVPNPKETLQQLEVLGADYILTSGLQTSAEKGLDLLQELNRVSEKTIVMAGGGVRLDNCEKFKVVGLRAIHLSGTSFGNEVPISEKISMNSATHLREDEIAVTNLDKVRQIVHSVK